MTIHVDTNPSAVLRWKHNGAHLHLYISTNSNTGGSIVWQELDGNRPSRVTGRNIKRLGAEIRDALKTGECYWTQDPTEALSDKMGLA